MFRELPESVIPRLLDELNRRKNVVNFGPGVPDFPMPEYLRDFSYEPGVERYGPVGGYPEVREAVADYAGAEDAILTTGATEGILLVLLALGEERVDVRPPEYLGYRGAVELAGKEVGESSLVLYSSPNNPTGRLKYMEGEVTVVDETYREFVYEGEHRVPRDSIRVGSFSKSLCIPGFRLGYVAGPEDMISRFREYQMYTSLHPTVISQRIVYRALEDRSSFREHVRKMVRTFKRRRDLVYRLLDREYGPYLPEGAYYFLLKTPGDMSGLDFAMKAMDNGVFVVPGEEFGAPGTFRLSYALPEERIEEGVKKLNGMVG